MPPKKTLATAIDIELADSTKVSKLNFGGGLQMRIAKEGQRYFQFRLSLGGNDTTIQLGKYPDMTLAQAQAKAKIYRSQVEETRQKRIDTGFRAKLKHLVTASKAVNQACFKNMEEAGQFMQRFSTVGVPSDLAWAVRLQMLLPAQASELYCAEWSDFNFGLGQWTVKQQKVKKAQRIAILSDDTIAVLHQLKAITGSSPYLFPELATTKKAVREKRIASAMQLVWPSSVIHPDEFRQFFKTMASEHSYFRAELIDAMLKYEDPVVARHSRSAYLLQRKALADWWSHEVMTFEAVPHEFGKI